MTLPLLPVLAKGLLDLGGVALGLVSAFFMEAVLLRSGLVALPASSLGPEAPALRDMVLETGLGLVTTLLKNQMLKYHPTLS